MKDVWARLGGGLGIAYCIAGFFLVFLGWNGAASNDSVSAQIPYVVSGGLAGLGLIVLGSALIIANSLRTDRVELRGSIDELRGAVERMGAGSGTTVTGRSAAAEELDADVVLAGAQSYHRPDCTLVQDQPDAVAMKIADARAGGRTPCRVCNPG